MTDKEQAQAVMMFIYNELFNEVKFGSKSNDQPSKKLSKLLKQIRINMSKLSEPLYQRLKDNINDAKVKGLDEIVRVQKGNYIASKEDIITVFWDSLNRNPYQEVWVKEGTVIDAINSLHHEKQNIEVTQPEIFYTNNTRNLIKSFVKHLGIKDTSGLATRRKIQEMNLICEGKLILSTQ